MYLSFLYNFFKNIVRYVYQLEKNLMNWNNKVVDQESGEKFQLFCRGSEKWNTKNLISYFIVVIVPKYSLY